MRTATILVATLLFGSAHAMAGEGGATADEAVAMVKKGITFLKANGPQKAFAEFNDKANAAWHDRDLYVVVYGLDGVVRAHGANAKMVGKNLLDFKDSDGKEFVRERVELAKKQASFWQDYKFTNPETKKIEPKRMYCERVDDSVLCGGIYK